MKNKFLPVLKKWKAKKHEKKEFHKFLKHPLLNIIRLQDNSIILACFGAGISSQGKRVITWNNEVLFQETKKVSLKKHLKKLYAEWKSTNKSLEDFMNTKTYNFSDDIITSIKKHRLSIKKGEKNIDLIDEAGFIVFRGPHDHIKKYIHFLNLPKDKRRNLIEQANENIAANPKIKPYNLSRKNAKIYNVPMSKNGGTPDFSGLKMYLNEDGFLGKKGVKGLPEGVSQAQLDDTLEKINKFGGVVRANITGLNRTTDFANSWKAMGVPPSLGTKIYEHYKLTWHHMDDLDENLQSGMQLILTEIHLKTVPHIGSHAQIKELLNLK